MNYERIIFYSYYMPKSRYSQYNYFCKLSFERIFLHNNIAVKITLKEVASSVSVYIDTILRSTLPVLHKSLLGANPNPQEHPCWMAAHSYERFSKSGIRNESSCISGGRATQTLFRFHFQKSKYIILK